MTVSTQFKTLEGDQLIQYVESNCARISNSQLAEECGYPSQDAFRDALTAARLFRGEYKDQHGIPNIDPELLQNLHFMLSITQSECVDIAVTLRDDYGINDLCDFNDVYAYSSEEYNWEAEFAQYWTEEVACQDVTTDASWVVIDWEATWNCNLRYDFSVIEYSDGVLILHNN